MTNADPVPSRDPDPDGGHPFEAIDISPAEIEIGIAIFDIEHREMLARLQDLYAAIADGEPREQVQRMLQRLLGATKQHFEHEEQYIRDYRYPDAARHIGDHQSLVTALETFVADLYAGTTALQKMATVRAYFTRWLLDHILEHDLALANFLVRRQIG